MIELASDVKYYDIIVIAKHVSDLLLQIYKRFKINLFLTLNKLKSTERVSRTDCGQVANGE